MIYTSYFGQLRNLPDTMVPIAICGGIPNWYSGLWYRKLAPKYKFFMEWKENHDNEYYIKCFNEQVLNGLNAVDIVTELYQLMLANDIDSKEKNICLLCYEKPEDFCHRHLVADWLTKNGIECKEWKKNG